MVEEGAQGEEGAEGKEGEEGAADMQLDPPKSHKNFKYMQRPEMITGLRLQVIYEGLGRAWNHACSGMLRANGFT